MNRKHTSVALLLTCLVALAASAAERTRPQEAVFSDGDVFLALINGQVQWRHSDGSLVRMLAADTDGAASGLGFDAAGNLYVSHWYGTNLTGNSITRFEPAGRAAGKLGGTFNCNPGAVAFDASGNAYLGQSGCGMEVAKLDRSGRAVSEFPVEAENGTPWVEMGADGCTLYYSTRGESVKRFDVCRKQELPDFNADPLPDGIGGARALRELPDGSLLVANFSVIVRLDATGKQAAVYDAPSEDCWQGLDLAPDGRSFFSSSWCSSKVYRFDLASGTVLAAFDSGSAPYTVKDLKVKRSQGAEFARKVERDETRSPRQVATTPVLPAAERATHPNER